MRIILDANILCRDFRFTGTQFREFLDAIARTGDTLVVPRLVVDEVKAKFREELREAARKIAKGLKRVRQMTEPPIESPLNQPLIEKLGEEYDGNLETRLGAASAVIVAYPQVGHAALAQRAMQKRRPFREGDTGYRDALIWEIVKQEAADSEETVLLVTADGDFSDGTQLHPELVEDLRSENMAPEHVHLYRSLDDLLREDLRGRVEALPPPPTVLGRLGIEEAIALLTSKRYDEALALAIQDFLGGDELDPEQLGFAPEFESPSIYGVEEIEEVDIEDSRRLSSGEFAISATVRAYCEFFGFIFKPNQYLGAVEGIYISDPDWNRHMAAGTASRSVDIDMSLTFDPETETITSMNINSIDDAERDY